MNTAPRSISTALALTGLLLIVTVVGACAEQEQPLRVGGPGTRHCNSDRRGACRGRRGSDCDSNARPAADVRTGCRPDRDPGACRDSHAATHFYP